jgi:hypothetical protein
MTQLNVELLMGSTVMIMKQDNIPVAVIPILHVNSHHSGKSSKHYTLLSRELQRET